MISIGPEAAIEKLEKLVRCGAKLVERLQTKGPALLCLTPARRRLEVEAASICGEMAGAQP